ncbi:NADPH-dependent FMN reductase [Methylobrevis pamukkalensis]|uniref:FMN-dependent NADPH-azoreductase n=1 Tax=Methylobrevis pamukkalensis TaxID=1439726 RepID=A0A1E3H5L0_9HYPH|nr:NAD(P)H-dependent oxidoreductase [Methylobrevis pamukkalensis]ODN71607.1 FMN-dependent NADPH-azoreductase [Methylobrevis pamukkalensis]
MSLELHVVVASTRPGRIGPNVARWFHEHARQEGSFDARLIDLADFGLPIYDEPRHPRMQKYEHAHTKAWSTSVAAADAFVFVAPEYNFGPTPALVNAINYLWAEWQHKPAAFVSYGGISGGMRAVQMTKPLLTTLNVMPIVEAVTIPLVHDYLTEDGFAAQKIHRDSADVMLKALYRWAAALKPMRA